MSSWRPKRCKRCGAASGDGIAISKLGYCPPCTLARVTESIEAMATKRGDDYDRWASHPRSRIGRPRPRGVGDTPTSIEVD